MKRGKWTMIQDLWYLCHYVILLIPVLVFVKFKTSESVRNMILRLCFFVVSDDINFSDSFFRSSEVTVGY